MSMMGTSVSGMMADSNWLSTISQNVANANTTGYKNAETEFSAIVDQVGAAPSAGGGVNTSTRALNSMQGNVVGTTTTTDLAIQGDGYFVVGNSSGDLFLTRNGSFVPDSQGDLVNSAGYYLMGYNVQNGATGGSSNSLAGMQKVNVTTSGEAATPTTTGNLAVNLPSTATAVTTAANLPSANNASATPTEETSLVTYDNLGGNETVNFYFTKTASDTWEVAAYNAADAAAGGGFPYSAGGLIGTATMNFNPTNGQLSSLSNAANGATATGDSLSFTVPNGQAMSLNLGSTTQLSAAFSVNAATANGNAPSSMTGVTISAGGTLNFQYSNGQTSPGYEIPLATVASEDNLTSMNGDAFQANQASGSVRVGTAGIGGFGTVVSSSLESSTVDLATELTQMIEAQSAYQANSKAFQAGANILDVLNNLKS